MKKFTLLVLLALTTMLSASSYAQIRWSVTGGYALGTFTASENGFSLSSNDNGFYAGILGDILTEIPHVTGEKGLTYSYLQDKTSSLTSISTGNGERLSFVKESIHFLNLPFKAKYSLPVSEHFGIFLLGGPTLAIGLDGNQKYLSVNYSMGYRAQEKNIPLFGEDGGLNRLDLKLGIGGGVTLYDWLELRVGYDWGLLNIASKTDISSHVHYFHAGIAIKFQKKNN